MRLVLIRSCRHFRHDAFDEQQNSVRRQRRVTIPQDEAAALVVPVVNNAFENNRIGDGWNCLEEVTRQEACPVGNALAPTDATGATALLKAADSAMYSGKQQGKDRVVRASSLQQEGS